MRISETVAIHFPLAPFSCYSFSGIFDKISSSDFVDSHPTATCRGGAKRRPWRKSLTTCFFIFHQRSRIFLIFITLAMLMLIIPTNVGSFGQTQEEFLTS
jgi:hypothetical protein